MNHHLFNHHAHSILVYIIIVVIVFYLIYKLYVNFGKHATCVSRLRAISPASTMDRGNTVNITIQMSTESLAASPEIITLQHPSTPPSDPPRISLRPRWINHASSMDGNQVHLRCKMDFIAQGEVLYICIYKMLYCVGMLYMTWYLRVSLPLEKLYVTLHFYLLSKVALACTMSFDVYTCTIKHGHEMREYDRWNHCHMPGQRATLWTCHTLQTRYKTPSF